MLLQTREELKNALGQKLRPLILRNRGARATSRMRLVHNNLTVENDENASAPKHYDNTNERDHLIYKCMLFACALEAYV